LTTVAIVDDMGAVIIIALGYSSGISGAALLAAAILLSAMFILNRLGVKALWPYLCLFGLLWVAVLLSGVHATIAGVLAASVIPIRATPGAPDAEDSPLHRLEHGLSPWVAFLIVPIFGFANAGVSFTGLTPSVLVEPVTLGVAAGLLFGTQIGVFGAAWLAIRLGAARLPVAASWAQLYGGSLLCGIGFTMSLFIGLLAFPDVSLQDEVKIGVLTGSFMSAVAGAALLSLAKR